MNQNNAMFSPGFLVVVVVLIIVAALPLLIESPPDVVVRRMAHFDIGPSRARTPLSRSAWTLLTQST